MPTPSRTAAAVQAWERAERQLDTGLQDAAAASYRTLADDPELAAPAHLRLSMIASNQSRHREAVDEALAACAARTPDPDLLYGIARRLVYLGEVHAALACALHPAMLGSHRPAMQAKLGELLAGRYMPMAALQLLERARANGHQHPSLDYLTGLCRMHLGDETGAEQALSDALAVAPDHVPSLRTLSKVRPPRPDEDRVATLQAVLDRIGEGHESAPMLLYTLFAEHDRRDDVPQAWAALEQAMTLRRAQVRYDAEAERALFDFLASTRPAAVEGAGDGGPRPVFVLGQPRSGTSLLEHLLAGHAGIAAGGELQDFNYQLRYGCDLVGKPFLDLALAQRAEAGVDFAEVGRRYLERTRWRARGRAAYVDKMPPNFLNVSHIVRALPQARILHMVRGPMDTCFSNLKEWFGGIYPHSYDQAEMADHFRRYRALMAHWRALYPDRILDVRYDELVSEPERVLREIVEFIGLPWQAGMAAGGGDRGSVVATPSAMQAREPVHRRYVDQWRRYEAYLGPLKERLGALAY